MGQGLCSRGCDSAVPAASERDPPARAELPTSAPQARSGSRRHLRMGCLVSRTERRTQRNEETVSVRSCSPGPKAEGLLL